MHISASLLNRLRFLLHKEARNDASRNVQDRILLYSPEGGSPTHHDTAVQLRRERVQVLAVDHALRRETLRASRLANELQKKSLQKAAPLPKSPGTSKWVG